MKEPNLLGSIIKKILIGFDQTKFFFFQLVEIVDFGGNSRSASYSKEMQDDCLVPKYLKRMLGREIEVLFFLLKHVDYPNEREGLLKVGLKGFFWLIPLNYL